MKMAETDVYKMAPGKGALPFPPYLQIELAEYTLDRDGHIFLSAQLMSDIEIDEAIDYLVAQLEKARKKAKRELKKLKLETGTVS
jgi:hypothetical protein